MPFPFHYHNPNYIHSHRSSNNTASINQRHHRIKRHNDISSLKEYLMRFQLKLRHWYHNLPVHYPKYYLEQRLPLVLIRYIQYQIKHTFQPQLDSLQILNDILESYPHLIICRCVKKRIRVLSATIKQAETDFELFIDSLAKTYCSNIGIRCNTANCYSPEEVVNGFYEARLEAGYRHNDVRQRRAAQIEFPSWYKKLNPTVPRVKVELSQYDTHPKGKWQKY